MRHVITNRFRQYRSAASVLLCVAAVSTWPSSNAAETAEALSERVLAVRNADSPISCAVADDYCLKRHVSHVLSIHCADSALSAEKETIAQAEYVRAIEQPIAAYLKDHPTIDFIVLTKGIPIRIHGSLTGNVSCAGAALDNCLAALGYDQIADATKDHFVFDEARGTAWTNRYWNAQTPFSHARYGGYLVTRLDGYTQADAMALVTRALAAEQHLPAGPVLLDIQPEFGLGDPATQPGPLPPKDIGAESQWSEFNADMAHAAAVLKSRGLEAELDLTASFIGNRSGLMGYFSWGSNDAHFEAAAYRSLTFAPGAVCDTAVSTSARTFLPTHGGQTLIADLIAQGVTGIKGYVEEPLLQAIASPTIVVDRYTSGLTLAESFYAASHFLGWEDVVIGDPICRPYEVRMTPAKRP